MLQQNGTLSSRDDINSTNDPTLIAFSHRPGEYDESISLEVIAGCDNPVIAVTTDGSEPDFTEGAGVTLPLFLDIDQPSVTTVKAKAVCPLTEPTETIAASYFLGIPHTLPVVSVIVDPVALNDPDTGLLNHVLNKGREWERPAHITLLDGNTVINSDIGLRIHGGSSREYPKKSWRLYFRSEYGLSRLKYPVLGENVQPQTYKRLVVSSGGQDWTMLRTRIVNGLADDLAIPTTSSRPSHLFINGNPQGIYMLRNHLSDHFFRGKFGYDVVEQVNPFMEGYEIHAPDGIDRVEQLSPVLQARWADNNWELMREFLATQSLRNDENLELVASKVNLPQLIDYYVLHMYLGNIDWIRNNYELFRPLEMANGSSVDPRWQFIVWDVDFALGLAPESWGSVEQDMFAYLTNEVGREDLERGAELIQALFENEGFREQFLSRMNELLETTLSESNVNKHIDAAVSEIEPDIDVELLRWGNRGDWAGNVDALHAFAKLRPDFMRDHAAAWSSTFEGQ